MSRSKIDLVSVVGAQAKPFVLVDRPSDIIPFKGDFPLVMSGERTAFLNAISDTQWIRELPDRFRKIVRKGEQMYRMDTAFRAYLKERNITPEQFNSKPKGERADLLIDWMTVSSLDFTSLEIKL